MILPTTIISKLPDSARERLAGALCAIVGLAFWPGIPGAAVTPRWAVLLVGLPWLVTAVPVTAAHHWLLALLVWSALTLAWTPMLMDGIDALSALAVFAGAVWLGSTLRHLVLVFIGFGIAMAINSAILVAQIAGWKTFVVLDPAGLFINPNPLAMIAAMVLVGLLVERQWLLAFLTVPAAVLTGSRGALLAIVAGLAGNLSRRWFLAVGAGVAVGVALLSFATRHLAGVSQRLDLWDDTLRGLSFFGQGVGSWYGLFPLFASRSDTLLWREAHAHNDFLELAFDVGVVGAILSAGFLVAALRGRDRAARAVLLAFVVEGMFSFPLHMPCTAFLGALCAGHLCRARNDVRSAAAHSRA